MELKKVAINDIVVEDRVRKVVGIMEMNSLIRSIMSIGLLQPIGVTPSNKLVYGARRLRACKQIGWDTIPAYVIDVNTDDPSAILRMEMDENDHRLDFKPSEKIELARRIEESLAGRRGNNQYHQKVDVQKIAHPQERTRDIVAKAVDMNRETYRQAKTVVESGNREVIDRMDKGELSIHAAYEQVKSESKQQTRLQTFRITLYKNPLDDASVILSKGGKDYGVKLAVALLKASGHKVDVE